MVCFWSIAGLLRNGNAEQAFGGHVASGARSLCLVAARADRMERCNTPRPIPAHFSACECLDNLGTEISRVRSWSGMGADLAGASDHRGTSDMVLPGQTILASSPQLHLSEMGDSFIAVDGLFTLTGSNSWFGRAVVAARKGGPRRILCRRLLCDLTVSDTWLL